MHITVCICTRNRGPSIVATLQSLVSSTYEDYDVVIVDQSTTDDTAQAVREVVGQDRRFIHLRSMTAGKSVALNIAIAQAQGPIIAFTDDDCEVSPDWLAVLAECFEMEPEVGVVGGALVAPKPVRRGFAICPALVPTEAFYDPISSGRKAPFGWDWLGANVAFRRSIMERIGRFDECLGPGSTFPIAEDTDYKLRLEAMGVKMRSTPRAVVYHTYGYRYGFRAVLRNSRNYARGNAGLAGKLTLSGDLRGQEWLATTKRECTSAWLRQLHRGRLRLPKLLRLWHYSQAYHECLRDYRIDPKTGSLSRVEPVQKGFVQRYFGGVQSS